MMVLYCLTLLLSAILLFSVEPMVGKMLLPQCGGAPAVWNTCMVFFQAMLLLGYAYAHGLTLWFGARRQAAIHSVLVLLPLLLLPVLFAKGQAPMASENPTLWLLVQLTLVVGLPFFVLTATTPLLQAWFAGTAHPSSRDPYFLYSISNAGSLLALLSYPFLIEPNIGLTSQSHIWTAGYLLLALLIMCCAATMWRESRRMLDGRAVLQQDQPQVEESQGTVRQSALGARQRLGWVFLAFVPSSLMLGVTSHISTDVAPAPLLWVIPLALYLLTFVIAFARRPLFSQPLMAKAMAYAVVLMPLLLFGIPMKVWVLVPTHWLTFFIVAMVCHRELALSRPDASRLTEFYLWVSVGGVLGGIFNTMVAPLAFNSVIEYPLMLVAACFLRPSDKGVNRTVFGYIDCAWVTGLVALGLATVWIAGRFGSGGYAVQNALVFGLPAVVCFCFKEHSVRFGLGVATVFLLCGYHASSEAGDSLLTSRDFFGVKRVSMMEHRFHVLLNGTTIHGCQQVYPSRNAEPVGYYSRTGPLGDVFERSSGKASGQHVAVIGLGTGCMAAYAEPGQRFTFYEIDPAVLAIASNPCLFTFLNDCRGKWEVVLGDARRQLATVSDGQFDMIVVDAFASDSIPLHLITREAMQIYCRKVKKNGILVFHVSSRYFDLKPALARLAEGCNLRCFARSDLTLTDDQRLKGKYRSVYVVMARHLDDLGNLSKNPQWSQLKADGREPAWTDDYSNVINAIQW